MKQNISQCKSGRSPQKLLAGLVYWYYGSMFSADLAELVEGT